MPDHLSRERIASLIDEPEAFGPERDHLDTCAECTFEYEQMVRMRMALSALPALAPPADEWKKIENRLAADVVPLDGAKRRPGRYGIRPVWAAAVVALFAAGLGVGRQLAPTAAPDSAPSGITASADDTEQPPVTRTAADDPTAAYLRTVAGIEELRREGPSAETVWLDPSIAAERLAKLDALIEASQEALKTAPSDPVLNNFLFEVVDERESLAGRMDESLRLVSTEY